MVADSQKAAAIGSQLEVAADIHSLRQQARIVVANSKLGCIATTVVAAKLLSLGSIADCKQQAIGIMDATYSQKNTACLSLGKQGRVVNFGHWG